MTGTSRFEVRTFGRDCFGNITGYAVMRGHGSKSEVAGQFVGNIYEPGSFERAKASAENLCAAMNKELASARPAA